MISDNIIQLIINVTLPGIFGVVINHRIFNNRESYDGSIYAFAGFSIGWILIRSIIDDKIKNDAYRNSCQEQSSYNTYSPYSCQI